MIQQQHQESILEGMNDNVIDRKKLLGAKVQQATTMTHNNSLLGSLLGLPVKCSKKQIVFHKNTKQQSNLHENR